MPTATTIPPTGANWRRQRTTPTAVAVASPVPAVPRVLPERALQCARAGRCTARDGASQRPPTRPTVARAVRSVPQAPKRLRRARAGPADSRAPRATATAMVLPPTDARQAFVPALQTVARAGAPVCAPTPSRRASTGPVTSYGATLDTPTAVGRTRPGARPTSSRTRSTAVRAGARAIFPTRERSAAAGCARSRGVHRDTGTATELRPTVAKCRSTRTTSTAGAAAFCAPRVQPARAVSVAPSARAQPRFALGVASTRRAIRATAGPVVTSARAGRCARRVRA